MKKLIFTIIGIIALAIPNFSSACMVVPEPRPWPDEPYFQPLRLKSHKVDVEITENFAETTVEQAFINESGWEVEADYIFPVPENASITDFTMSVNGEDLSPELRNSDEAREFYEKIVREQRDPGLLEYVGQDLISVRIYPIAPDEEKKVVFTYSQELTSDPNYSYSYPLSTGQTSGKIVEEVEINVEIKMSQPLKVIYSPTYEIEKDIDENTAKISYEDKNVNLDKDFDLVFSTSDEQFGATFLTHYNEEDDQGYFFLALAPDYSPGDYDPIPKDIVITLDTSGSMSGEKIQKAKEAVEFILENLGEEDRVSVITFSDKVGHFISGLDLSSMLHPPCEKNFSCDYLIRSKEIHNFYSKIDKISASGGTNIYDALETSLKTFDDSENPKYLIFLTDGQATVGNTDTEDIIANTIDKNDKNVKVFSFGIGYDVNTQLLDKLSNQNGGISEYINEDEDLEVKISNFYKKIQSPVLSDPEIEIISSKNECGYKTRSFENILPNELNDFFIGTQQIVVGKYEILPVPSVACPGEKPEKGSIKLSGKKNGEEISFEYDLSFNSSKDNFFIEKLWASREIGKILDNIRLEGESESLKKEIIELSEKYGIVTPYTSFLITLPGELDQEEKLKYAMGELDRSFEDKDFYNYVGASANQNSASTQNQKNSDQVATYNLGGQENLIQEVSNKTFFYKDGYWVESGFENEDLVVVKQFSDEFFDLAKDSQISDYLSVGNAKFTYNGINYEISTGEASTNNPDEQNKTKNSEEEKEDSSKSENDLLTVFGGVSLMTILVVGFLLTKKNLENKNKKS